MLLSIGSISTPHLGQRPSSGERSRCVSSGSQLFGGMEPIFLGRSLRTASFLPQFMRQCGDVVVPERGDAVPARNRLGMSVGPLGVLKRLPGMLLPAQVILVAVLLGNPMGVSGVVVQFGGELMVLVVRSVIVASRHRLEAHNLPRLGVGFFRELVGMIGEFQRPL
jgi:hypothetical protein